MRSRLTKFLALVVLLAGAAVAQQPASAGGPVTAASLAELEAWHRALAPVLSLPGVVLTDANEQTLQLLVGVENLSTSGAVLDRAEAAGIPRAAVVVEEWGPVRPALDDRRRPMYAGTQIQFQSGFLGLGTGTCTSGFMFGSTAINARGFVTNSHCTRTRSSLDNGRYWQPTRPPSDGDQVGTEVSDPAFFTGGACPSGRRCRYSDAAAIRGTSAADVSVGTVARPPLNSADWNGTDRYILNAEAVPTTTMTATKVGRTTGRTQGAVTHTCVSTNVTDTDITMLCQYFAAARVDPGDSGSPVIQVTNSPNTHDATLLGLLWGEATASGVEYFAFSSVSRIEMEIGAMSTYFGA